MLKVMLEMLDSPNRCGRLGNYASYLGANPEYLSSIAKSTS